MKSKPNPVLIAFIIIIILVSGFSIYENSRSKEIKEPGEKYIVEEIIEPGDIIPEETAEIPTVESGEEKEVINQVTIVINNLRFYPKNLTISPGTTVTWVNNDTVPHQVVAYDRVFYGPRLEPGDKYSFTFTTERSHKYFDAVFPKMGRGAIVVQEEPLPITGGVIAADLAKEESNAKLALLVILFAIMILGLSHGIYKHNKI